ncbi:MAG: hypothetical protein ACK5ZK_11260 [Armatimonadota bacterium]|nr:hypothetical protein [Fimbriimonadaceae bacterium]
MAACEMSPPSKRAYISAVGEELVKRHGKKKHYDPADIRTASLARGFAIDYVCWAHAIFATPGDFKALHDALGEACNYTAMRAEVLKDLSGGSFQWPDVDLSWLDWPDIDLSGIFDWFPWNP